MEQTYSGAWRLEPVSWSAPRARRLVVEGLHVAALDPDVIADAELVTSELVANAILHGQPPIDLSLTVSGANFRIEVTDSNPAPPRLLPPAASDQVGGRGLLILDTLARRWGVDATASGKRVWAELGP